MKNMPRNITVITTGDEVITDVRLFHCVEQSKLVLTLCVEQRHGDTRLAHYDFPLTLLEALVLKASIDQAELDKRQENLVESNVNKEEEQCLNDCHFGDHYSK